MSVAGALGSSLGALIGAIIISYIFWLLRTLFIKTNPKPQFKDKLLKYSSVYICISLFIASSNNYRDEKSSAGVVDEVNRDVSSYIGESLNDEVGFLEHTDLEFDDTNSKEIVRLIKAVLNERVTLNNEYVAFVNNLGLEKLFDPNWMADYGNISSAKDSLAELNSITKNYHAEVTHMVSEPYIISKLNSLNLNYSQADYEEFIGGFKRGVEKQSKRSELLFDSEVELLDKYGLFISFIEMNKDYWIAEDGAFIFQRHEDLDEFNKLVGEIQLIERMQSQMLLDLRGDFVE